MEFPLGLSARQKSILSQVKRNGRVRVDALSDEFETTPQTIRKDLQRLAQEHHVVRFHGGAALLAGTEYVDQDARRSVATDQKTAIGEAAARLIPPNSAIFINSGTTTERFAAALWQSAGLRVITDNVELANKIRVFTGVEVIVAGGQVRRSDGAIIGPQAVDFFRGFMVDFAVIGTTAVTEDGALFDYDLQEVAVVKAIIENARHVILTLDSSKFSRTAPVRFGHLRDVHTLVTDSGAPSWVSEICRECEVDFIEVPTVGNRKFRSV